MEEVRFLEEENKAREWFKGNLDTIIIVLLCLVFVFRGIADIDKSGKVLEEIIIDGSLAFSFSILIKSLMKKQGISSGLNSKKFISTCNVYGDAKQSISNKIEYLEDYCNYKNEKNFRAKQTDYLLKYGLSYSKFTNGEYNERKELNKIIKKVRNLKVVKLTPVMITNAYDDSNDEYKIMNYSIKNFNRKQGSVDLIIGLFIMAIFGYYSLERGVFDIAVIIWYALQIIFYVSMGYLKMRNAFHFVTESLRGKINYSITLIDEFNNLYNKNVFDVDKK